MTNWLPLYLDKHIFTGKLLNEFNENTNLLEYYGKVFLLYSHISVFHRLN